MGIDLVKKMKELESSLELVNEFYDLREVIIDNAVKQRATEIS